MIDETRQWRLPIQAAPVDRMPGSAARNGGSGIEPSSWLTDLLPIASTVASAIPGVGPIAGPVLGALGSIFG
jgi:hypothetical protein